MNPKTLKGRAVVTVAEAQRMGRVHDVVFETSPLKSRGLRFETDSGARTLGLDRIRSVGADAVMVDDAVAVDTSERDLGGQRFMGLDELGRLKVVDEDGSYLGEIADLDIDLTTGQIASLDVSKGGLLGVGAETVNLPADRILSVGSELLTVSRGTGAFVSGDETLAEHR